MRSFEDLDKNSRAWHQTPDLLNDLAEGFEALGDERSLAHALLCRARALNVAGSYTEGFHMLDEVTAKMQELGDDNGLARAFASYAWVRKTTGDFPRAQENFLRARELFARTNDLPGVASTHTHVGSINGMNGNYLDSLKEIGAALSIYEQLGDAVGIASSKGNIGTIYITINDPDRALKAFDEALALHIANGDLRFQAITISNIAFVYIQRKQFDKAIEHLNRALDLRIQLSDPIAVAETRGNLGEVYQLAGMNDEAKRILNDLDESISPNPIFRIDIAVARAKLLANDGDLESARSKLLQALHTAEELVIPTRCINIHLELRDIAQRQNDLAAYIEHNAAYLKLTEETSGARVAREIITIEKEQELTQANRELDQHRSVLHSTLPKHIADRVVRGEQVTDHIDDAAVFFLDIVGFTTLSSALTSQQVAALLDAVFAACDTACTKNNITRIKTIGDSYLAFTNSQNAK